MFSVEDLLVSHGYRVAKSSLSSYQSRPDGYQHQALDSRAGNGIVNGYQPDSEAANPTQSNSDHENCVNKRRQICAAGYPRGHPASNSCHTSQAGILERLHAERPCWVRTDKDIQYWRRKGQDFSVLFSLGENGTDDQTALPINVEGKRRFNIIDKNAKECHNTVIENVVKTRKKVAVGVKTVEQQTSDGSCEKLEDLISLNLERSQLVCPVKQKIQLISKGSSPEDSCHMAITSSPSDTSSSKESKNQDKDNYIVHQDCSKPSFSKPKYSRPSKPPSYEVHQQTWGAVDIGETKDNQQKDEHHASPKVLDLLQESCSHESGMEPPNYIPPPSYKSPPLVHAASKPFKKVPRSSDCMRRNILAETTSTNDKKTIGFLGHNGPFTKPTSHRHLENCKQSVQYISFDDPRIKHIGAAKEAEKHKQKKYSSTNDSSRVEHQEINIHKREQDSAFINPKNVEHHHVKREGIKHKQWLHISIADQICCPLPENRDGATACSLPEDSEPTHKLSLKKTHSDSACETVTKVKKFEPESFVFSKKSSKRKLNETIFCLVSIPVKCDSSPSDICKNNNRLMDNTDRMNMLKHSNAGLPEQRLLSASSSDLELQTLTGNLNNNTELLKQAQLKTEENKQANDLRSGDLQHRELTYSGSWPGDQYKDQQTQTTDIEILPLCNATNDGEQIDPWPPSENNRPNVFGIKGQIGFAPSSNSAFSRTSSLLTQIPKTEPLHEIASVKVDGKDKVVKCDKNVTEEDHSCNKKEVFGQFLLKPVSRRPWDAIRELESLNKEFQEPESCATNGEKNIVREQSKVIQIDMSSTRTAMRREMLSNTRHIIEVEEVPIFEALQSNLENWDLEKLTYDHDGGVEVCESSNEKDIKNKPEKKSDKCTSGGTQVQVKKSGDKDLTLTTTIVQKPPEQSHVHKKIHTKSQLSPDSLFHHFKEDKTCFDHTFFDVVKVSSAKFGQIGENMLRKLSFTDRNHGRSVPDLTKHCADTGQNGDFFEEHNFLDIPENESLHERAARILGIEVAEESLVSNGSSETQSPENIMCDNREQPEKNVSRKVSEISFSTNETPRVFKSVLHLPVESERTVEKLRNINQGQEPSLMSSLVSDQNETNITRNAERRIRNTSKMIETLQGKLASTPVRTAVDRLARMKEVDSVSRMRRLSIKSTDSGDELDDEKHLHGTQDGRTRKFSIGSIYKRVISLDESLIPTKNKEKLDLSCADAYDPTRVERV